MTEGVGTGDELLAHLASVPPEKVPELVSGMTSTLRTALASRVFRWEVWARPTQLWPTGKWSTWLIMTGRRWGKTRTGREYTHRLGLAGGHRIALIARTHGDLRDIMLDGESGLLSRDLTPPGELPRYNPSVRRLTWPRPKVGYVAGAGQIAVGDRPSIATTLSSEEPDDIRGPGYSFAWCDELAAWTHLEACWSNLDFALSLRREGWNPRRIVTTTPRPLRFLEELVAKSSTVVTEGTLYDNVDNLPETIVEQLREEYEGTDLGEQEILGRILRESKGALWRRAWIEENRVDAAPGLTRIVVGVDPPGSSGPKSAEAGIGAVGVAPSESPSGKPLDHFYVLEDRSMVATPERWGAEAIALYQDWEADAIVGETNYGGEMVRSTIHVIDDTVTFIPVPARKSKQVRAQPIAILYQKGLVHHVGVHRGLEDQQCTWEPLSGMPSPDRIDWLVHAITALRTPRIELPTSLGGIGDADRQSPWRI